MNDRPGAEEGSAPRNRLSAAADLEEFSDKEKDSIEARSRPSAALIHETIRAEGESELQRTVSALLLSGVAAGLSIGFSLILEGLMHARLPEAPWRELVSNLGYTVGFLIVVLGRQQLFTENTLTPVLPLLHHRNLATLWRVLRLWGLVLAANIAGTWMIAAVVAHTAIFPPDLQAAFHEISKPVMEGSFAVTFTKAVFAGWLIALMAWLLPAADASRPLIIIIITYVVGLGGFVHIVAGSVDAFYLVQVGAASWADYFSKFFVPVVLGNILGGVALVAAFNYGQVAPEIAQ
jgi:formate/nitrite transporter FocA (FNT family)